MSLAMGRLPAILVGQIPVVTTTEQGEGQGVAEGVASRTRDRKSLGISRFSLLPRLFEKKKERRREGRKRKATRFSSPREKRGFPTRKRPRLLENHARGRNLSGISGGLSSERRYKRH